MALSAAGSALVAGSTGVQAMAAKTVWVNVARSFYFGGEPRAVGSVVEVPAIFAQELIGVGKAVAAEEPKKKPAKEASNVI